MHVLSPVRLGDCVCVYVAPDPLKQPVSDPDVGNEVRVPLLPPWNLAAAC